MLIIDCTASAEYLRGQQSERRDHQAPYQSILYELAVAINRLFRHQGLPGSALPAVEGGDAIAPAVPELRHRLQVRIRGPLSNDHGSGC